MTKKFNYKWLAACCLAAFSLFNTLYSQAAVWDSFTEGDLEYTVLTEEGTTGTVVVMKENSSVSGNLTIPDSVVNNGITYSVTEIGEEAFFGN